MAQPNPGSLSEGAGSPQGLTEGVSSDGCSGPMIYTPAHINSVIFERLRSSKYTPSVSHSLDSSLREGAGRGAYHSTGYSLKSGVSGDFHRPYETQNVLHSTIHPGTRKTVSVYHTFGFSISEERTRAYVYLFQTNRENAAGNLCTHSLLQKQMPVLRFLLPGL